MLNNLICFSLLCVKFFTPNSTYYEDVEKKIEFNFPDLISVYKLGLLSTIQIEAYKSTFNDKLKFEQLNWFSIGFPAFVSIKTTNFSENLFNFTPECFYAHINMLTNSHRLMFKEMIKYKYDIDINNNQIKNVPLELFVCWGILFDEQKNERYLINGQVKDFSQLPLKLQFDFNNNTKERQLFEKLLMNSIKPFDMRFECKIASKYRKYEYNTLKIELKQLDQLDILEKLFGKSKKEKIFVNYQQMVQLAVNLYTQLNIMYEYQLSEYEFINIFIEDFIRQTADGFFEYVPFYQAINSLSSYGICDNFGENLFDKLFKINISHNQEQIVVNMEHLSKYNNYRTEAGEFNDFKLFRVKSTYNHVRERLYDWIKLNLNLNDQLKEMNECTESDIKWHYNQTRIEPKSLKVAELNRAAFNKTLIFNQIRKFSIESPFQINLALNTINNFLFSDCFDLFNSDLYHFNGIFNIYPNGVNPIPVHCEFNVNGAWTRIMNRVNATNINFDKTYKEYLEGFGEIGSNYWMGLYNIRKLVQSKTMSLRIEVSNKSFESFVEYESFFIDSEANDFKLTLGPKIGGDLIDVFKQHNGFIFSAIDKIDSSTACAKAYKGGWWFGTCYEMCLTCANAAKAKYKPGHIYDNKKEIWIFFENIKMFLRPKNIF